MAIFMLFSAIPLFAMDCLLAHPMGGLIINIEPMGCRNGRQTHLPKDLSPQNAPAREPGNAKWDS